MGSIHPWLKGALKRCRRAKEGTGQGPIAGAPALLLLLATRGAFFCGRTGAFFRRVKDRWAFSGDLEGDRREILQRAEERREVRGFFSSIERG